MSTLDACSKLVDAARALAPLAREHAAQGERERRLPAPLVEAFKAAGFFRMCRPEELGGISADTATMIRVCEELARGDASASWCVSVNAYASAWAGYFPKETAHELFGDPNTVAGGVANASGMARVVDGGYEVTGSWRFASSCQHSDWMFVSAYVIDGGKLRPGPHGPESIVSIVPASQFTVVDTWDTAGLRGTGSHDVNVSQVFVPENHTLRFPPVPVHPHPVYKFPVVTFGVASQVGVALGSARAAIDEAMSVAREKRGMGVQTASMNRPTVQVAIGEAEGALRSGRAWVMEMAAELWDTVCAGNPITGHQKAMFRVAAITAVQHAVRAVDLAYTTSGGSAIYSSHPLQRHFRDVHALTQHAWLATHSFEIASSVLLGALDDHPML